MSFLIRSLSPLWNSTLWPYIIQTTRIKNHHTRGGQDFNRGVSMERRQKYSSHNNRQYDRLIHLPDLFNLGQQIFIDHVLAVKHTCRHLGNKDEWEPPKGWLWTENVRTGPKKFSSGKGTCDLWILETVWGLVGYNSLPKIFLQTAMLKTTAIWVWQLIST